MKDARKVQNGAGRPSAQFHALAQILPLAKVGLDEDRVVAERVRNTMRHNAATVMLNRAMSEYAKEGGPR